MKKGNNSKGAVSLRLAACIAVFFTTITLFLAPAQAPSWWTSRQVTSGTTLSGTANYAAANQGQLKNIATQAYYELQANLPGGVGGTTSPGDTGSQLNALINSWSTGTSGTLTEITGSYTADYAAVNIGQVKQVASLFYNRLIEVGYTKRYPWWNFGNTPNDYAAANIGQIKNLFNFDVTTHTSSDGIPDWWELNYFGTIGLSNIGLSGTSLAPSGVLDTDGDPMTIAGAYAAGVSPDDYYNGVPPTLTIISGSGLSGSPGEFLSGSLIVQVEGPSGLLVNAPVTFTVVQGVGILSPDNTGSAAMSPSLVVRTGTNGRAQVCFKQPLDASFTSMVAVTAETSEVDFSETTGSDTGDPAAPSHVAATVQPDGSILVTWKDKSDNETGFNIYLVDGGSTTLVGTVGPDNNSILLSATAVGTSGSYSYNVASAGTDGSTVSSTNNGIPVAPLPTISYVPIDLSSGTNPPASSTILHSGTEVDAPTSNVLSIALGDDNTASYCYSGSTYSGTYAGGYSSTFTGTATVIVNRWANGVTMSSTMTTITGSQNGTASSTSGTYPGTMFSSLWGIQPFVTSKGGVFGTETQTDFLRGYEYPVTISMTNPYSVASGSTQPQIQAFSNPLFATQYEALIASNLDWQLFGPEGISVAGCSETGYFGAGSFVCVPYGVWENDLDASYVCTISNTNYGTSSGTTIFYDPASYNSSLSGSIPTSSTLHKVGHAFTPTAMNDFGNAIGTGTYSSSLYFWSGTVSGGTAAPVLLDSTGATQPASQKLINDQSMVVGNTTVSGSQTGMLWLLTSGTASSGTFVPTPIQLQSLIPKVYQPDVQNISPVAISNADAHNRVWIACTAGILEVHGGSAPASVTETVLLNVDATYPSGTTSSGSVAAPPPSICLAKHPEGVNFPTIQSINSSGDIVGIADLQSTGTNHAALFTTMDIAVDSNRDGTIVMPSDAGNPANVDPDKNPLPIDTTSREKPFKFWLNNGCDGWEFITPPTPLDTSLSDPVQVDLDPSLYNNYPNYTWKKITYTGPTSGIASQGAETRNLENFARLWINTTGWNQAISSGQVIVGLEWHPNTGDAITDWQTNDGNPSITIYPAVNGDTKYLTDTDYALLQASGTYSNRLGTGVVARGTPFYFPSGAFVNVTPSSSKVYFLFEAAGAGKGRLVVTLNKQNPDGTYTKIGGGGQIYMDLEDVKMFYERWTVGGDTNKLLSVSGGNYYWGGLPTGSAAPCTDRLPAGVTTPFQYTSGTTSDPGLSIPGDPDGNKYIIFLHGYNVPPWSKDVTASTVFKRLYWQGYKGKFGAFDWPCSYHLDGSGAGGVYDFDQSEYSAWLSGAPLNNFLVSLKAKYKQVFCLAHSHGNVVVGEALRLSPYNQTTTVDGITVPSGGPVLDGYIATQAAIDVQCYDPAQTTPANYWTGPLQSCKTPNVYPTWNMQGNAGAATSMANFFNVNDDALSYFVWETDERLKPDTHEGLKPPYGWDGNGFTNSAGYIYLGSGTTINNQYEIMGYAAQAQCLPLGRTSNAANMTASLDLSTVWPHDLDIYGNGFSDLVWHSSEFEFSNDIQYNYWNNVLKKFGFTPNPKPQ